MPGSIRAARRLSSILNLHQAQQLKVADISQQLNSTHVLPGCLAPSKTTSRACLKQMQNCKNIAQRMPWSTDAADCRSAVPIRADLLARTAHLGRRLCLDAGPQQGPVVGQHLDTCVCREGAQHATQARHRKHSPQGQQNNASCTPVFAQPAKEIWCHNQSTRHHGARHRISDLLDDATC